MRPSLEIQVLRPDERPVVRLGETVLGEVLDVCFEETPSDAQPVRRVFVLKNDERIYLGPGGSA